MQIFVAGVLLAAIFILVSSDSSQVQAQECRRDIGGETNRRFAYKLYGKALASAGPDENVFLAPTTVSKALVMVLLGAKGNTKSQIWNGLTIPQTSIRVTEDDLPCVFGEHAKESKENGDGKALELREASQLFGELSYKFDVNFVRKSVSFGVPLLPLDFSKNASGSRETINSFVAHVTRDKIPNLFAEGDITADTVLAITSAIYFKGLWQTEFDPKETRKQDFRINEGKTVQADFMRATMSLKSAYSMELDATLLELPYKADANGRYDISMVIVQPETSMDALKDKITEEHLSQEIKNLFQNSKMAVKLTMPKFKMSQSYELTGLLKNMGMTDMFDQTLANLTGMSAGNSPGQPNLYVGSAVHKTFIEVDEKGTEASGATGIVILGRSSVPTIELDRPFLCVIYEKRAGRVLFIGRLSDPTAE